MCLFFSQNFPNDENCKVLNLIFADEASRLLPRPPNLAESPNTHCQEYQNLPMFEVELDRDPEEEVIEGQFSSNPNQISQRQFVTQIQKCNIPHSNFSEPMFHFVPQIQLLQRVPTPLQGKTSLCAGWSWTGFLVQK